MRIVSKVVGAIALAGLATASQATVVDLTSPMSAGVINGTRFETTDFRSAGTGVIQSFVRIQATGTEQGYNTSGRPVAFDENTSGNYTRNLQLGDVPVRVINGVAYKEFLLDINQTNASPLLSLDQVKIFTSTVGSQTTNNVASLGTLRYDMDAGGDSWVKMDYSLASGSGQGDVRMLVPVSDFAGATDNQFVYLYSQFGTNFASNDGFEEWSVQSEQQIVPLPLGSMAGGLGLLTVAALRRKARR
jgi:hypothetical protein